MEHATVNEAEAFGIPPDRRNKGQYFVYTIPFYKQQVYKKEILTCWTANVSASPQKPGAGGTELIEITNFYVNRSFYVLTFMLNFVALKDFQRYRYDKDAL